MSSSRRVCRRALPVLVLALGLGALGPAAAQEEVPEQPPPGEPIPADDDRGIVHSWALAPSGAGGGSQTGERANLTYEMAPGTVVTDRVTLFNFSNVELTFDVFPIDATNNDEGAFTPLPQDAEQTGVGAWVTIPVDQLTVPAGQAASVDLVINVPPDAPPGDHAGAVLASNDARGTSPDGRIITLDRQTGTRVYIRVDGPLRPELAVARLATHHTPKVNPLDGSAEVTYRIENRGNVRLAGTHRVSVSGPLGLLRRSGELRHLPELLPGEGLEFTETIDGVAATVAAFTEVDLEPLTVDGSEDDVKADDRTAIGLALPYLLIALLIAAGLVWVARRRYRKHGDRRPHRAPERRPEVELEPQPT